MSLPHPRHASLGLLSATAVTRNEAPKRLGNTKSSQKYKHGNSGIDGARIRSSDASFTDSFDPIESGSDCSDGARSARLKHRAIDRIIDPDSDSDEAPPIKPGTTRKHTTQRPVFKMPPGIAEATGTRRPDPFDTYSLSKKTSARAEAIVEVTDDISDFEGGNGNAILRL